MVRQLGFAAVLIAFVCSTVLAADPWIGQKVFWKETAKAKIGNDEVSIDLLPFPSKVEAVNGEWLWLGRAWVHKSDVMLSQQAFDYYSEQIRLAPTQARNWAKRGLVRQDQADFEDAIEDFVEAILLDPNYASALNNIAWLRATCPTERYRNGTLAVGYAKRACELTSWNDFSRLDTLAAAYAQLGDFTNAVTYQEKAIALATNAAEKQELRSHLTLYKAGKPYRDAQEVRVARQIDFRGWRPQQY